MLHLDHCHVVLMLKAHRLKQKGFISLSFTEENNYWSLVEIGRLFKKAVPDEVYHWCVYLSDILVKTTGYNDFIIPYPASLYAHALFSKTTLYMLSKGTFTHEACNSRFNFMLSKRNGQRSDM